MDDKKTDHKAKWTELKADPIRYAFHLEQQRAQYAKRRERERLRSKAKYQRDKEYYKKKHAEWWAAHPDKYKEYATKKYREHRDRELERKRRWRAEHPEEERARGKGYREGPNREKWLKTMLRSAHKSRLSAEQLEALWERSRNGPCEICGLTGQVMHLDHNHTINTFRGILCDGCNRGIGFFKENPFALIAAVNYLNARNG